MYLSKILLTPRSRQVRSELAEPYEMHRTLLRAFPDKNAGGPGRVLFRVDLTRETGMPALLVQSERLPDWSRLPVGEKYLLELFPPKEFRPNFQEGQRLMFRLRANPTIKRDGKRLGLLHEDEQETWLRRKSEEAGFAIQSLWMAPEGLIRGAKTCGEDRLTLSHFAVRFDGSLRVIQPDRLATAMQAGIGSGKAFGFGLLSLAAPTE
jgi:CRISPR system Cascade subunit CasE